MPPDNGHHGDNRYGLHEGNRNHHILVVVVLTTALLHSLEMAYSAKRTASNAWACSLDEKARPPCG
jgi:hypothetical protein